MTTVDAAAYAAAPAAPRGRIFNVVRLQYVNRQTFIWVPLMVLGASWLISLMIYGILHSAGIPNVNETGNSDGIVIGGGAQAPMWYYLAVGIQALSLTFPFSQAVSLTRREFFLGSLLAAAISAAGMAFVFVGLGLIEQVTNGYGLNGYFSYLGWVWAAGPVGAWFAYFTTIMLFFVVGFWFSVIYKQYGTAWLTAIIIGIALLLVGLIALFTWQQMWPEVGAWFVTTGIVGLTLWELLLGAVLAVGCFLTLRRVPA